MIHQSDGALPAATDCNRCIAAIGPSVSNPILHTTDRWFSVPCNQVLHKTARFQGAAEHRVSNLRMQIALFLRRRIEAGDRGLDAFSSAEHIVLGRVARIQYAFRRRQQAVLVKKSFQGHRQPFSATTWSRSGAGHRRQVGK